MIELKNKILKREYKECQVIFIRLVTLNSMSPHAWRIRHYLTSLGLRQNKHRHTRICIFYNDAWGPKRYVFSNFDKYGFCQFSINVSILTIFSQIWTATFHRWYFLVGMIFVSFEILQCIRSQQPDNQLHIPSQSYVLFYCITILVLKNSDSYQLKKTVPF